MNELVSIVIPVYNAELYLDEAITSCLDQTYSKVEIIAVDDGSSDNSLEILKNYEDKVLVKSEENRGVAAAINYGIHSMNGKLFKIMNSDDAFYSDAVEILVSEFNKLKNKKTIIHGDGIIVDNKNNFVREFHHSDLSHLSQFDQNVVLLNRNMVTNVSTLFHTETFSRCGLYNESLRFGEDYELWLRLCIQFGYKLHYIPRKIVKIKEHEKSLTPNTLKNKPNIGEEVRDLFLKRLDLVTQNKYQKALKQYQKNQTPLRRITRHMINKFIIRYFSLKEFITEIPIKFESSVVYRNEAKIYWWRGGKNNKNFGDLITSYIYLKSKGRKPAWCNNKNSMDPVYFGSGSLMGLCKGWKNLIIWGTGIINLNENFDRPNKILCVRGPLTRKRFLELGYDCPELYGDIGLLLPRFYKAKIDRKYKVGIIPHYVDYEFCMKLFSKFENVIIIDVCREVEEVINDICNCERTISSSLHGIIVSHAYNFKSCWIKFSNKISGDDVKYLDYYYSINLYNVKKPVLIDQEFLKHLNNVSELIEIIENYPNPNFPINTEKLMKTFPF